jgi:hypothetical protein
MTGWTSEELDRIGAAEELEVASLRADGTLRQPVTIWVIREGDDLYVRSWRGRSGGRYGSSYVGPMTSGETRTTTLRLEPRAAKGAA